MLIGVLILRKQYKSKDYLAALLLCGGVIGVTFGNAAMVASAPVDAPSSYHQALGILLTMLSVVLDAISPVLQELLMRDWKVSMADVMLYTNLCGFLGIATIWYQTQEWIALAKVTPAFGGAYTLASILIPYGFCSYFGIAFLLMLIRVWGSAVGVAVTTLRKVVTVVISFIAFPKELTMGFVVSGVMVLASIAVAACR